MENHRIANHTQHNEIGQNYEVSSDSSNFTVKPPNDVFPLSKFGFLWAQAKFASEALKGGRGLFPGF